jgi:hypothetical protein
MFTKKRAVNIASRLMVTNVTMIEVICGMRTE